MRRSAGEILIDPPGEAVCDVVADVPNERHGTPRVLVVADGAMATASGHGANSVN